MYSFTLIKPSLVRNTFKFMRDSKIVCVCFKLTVYSLCRCTWALKLLSRQRVRSFRHTWLTLSIRSWLGMNRRIFSKISSEKSEIVTEVWELLSEQHRAWRAARRNSYSYIELIWLDWARFFLTKSSLTREFIVYKI